MGKDGISGGTEEQDAVLSAQDALTAGSAHPDSAGEGRKAFEAARFRGRESSGTSGSGARPPFPGAQLATAGHSWPQQPEKRPLPGALPQRCRAQRRCQGASLVQDCNDAWLQPEKSCIN